MKKFMIKPLVALVALALCVPAFAQNQPAPNPEPDTPQQFPAQFTPQFGGGESNGIPQEAVGELIQELMKARDALDAAKQGDDQNQKPDDAGGSRRLRGEGTRGTMGSGTNTQSLMSLVTKSAKSGGTNASALRLNFRNASLSLVLDYLSEAAGLVISANSKVDLQGKVTVWSNQAVDRNEAIRLLNAALTSSGYAATVEGNLLNIYVVDATNTEIVPGVPGNDYTTIPPTKDLVTQIVYIHNVEAGPLISSLQPLMPAGTSMSANQGANAIVVTDTKANIRRMVQLVKALDTASVSASKLEVFLLQYADATALATVVQQVFSTDSSSSGRSRGGFGGFPGFGEMFGGGGGDRGRGGSSSSSTQAGRMSGAKVTAVADERSNSLVVTASDEQMLMVSNLVTQMDVNVDDIAELRVFRLRYADPQEMAEQLASLFPDPSTQQSSSGRSGFRGFGGFGGFSRGSGSSGTDTNSRRMKQTRVSAVPDPRTGSVIVSASRDYMGEIAGIIQELDSDPAKKKKVTVIKVENRDPADLVQELQGIISSDSSGNFNNNSSTRQSGSQLNTRQQNNLQNQGSGTSSGLGGSFGSGSGATRSTGR